MKLSKLISCRHCGNISKMEIIGTVNDEAYDEDPEFGGYVDAGTYYEVLRCPACSDINIVSYFWPPLPHESFRVSRKQKERL